MFTEKCFIRKNTKDLRNKLEKIGRTICICADNDDENWKDSVWLIASKENHQHPAVGRIHGLGYWDEIVPFNSVDEVLEDFLKSNEKSNYPSIDCGDNDELFLAICALNDETDKHQWFYSTGWTDFEGNPIPDKWVFCDQNTLEHFAYVNNSPNSYSRDMWKKATAEELIEHFKN